MRQKKLTQQQRIETLERIVAKLYIEIQTNSKLLKKLTHDKPAQKNSRPSN